MGGFPPNTSAELIVPVFDGIRTRFGGIVGAYPSGKITNKALLVFKDKASAWNLMEGMKGITLEFSDGIGGTIKL